MKPYLTEVGAINIVRGLCGLSPISTASQDTKVKNYLDRAVLQLCHISAYNTDRITFTPNSSGKIDVSEYVNFTLPDNPQNKYLVEKDGFLWDSYNQEYYSSSISDVFVTTRPQWANIPNAWQHAITYRAATDFLLAFQGANPKYTIAQQKAYNYLCAAEIESPWPSWSQREIDERNAGFSGGV